jgi:tRNA-guanine family transglycosylase
MLAAILISHHNLAFFLDTMRRVRQAIRLGNFGNFRKEFINKIKDGDKERET